VESASNSCRILEAGAPAGKTGRESYSQSRDDTPARGEIGIIDPMPSIHGATPTARTATNRLARFRLAVFWRMLVAIAALGLGGFAGAQEIGNGSLLIATPELADPNFSHSVVLLLRRDDNGAIGVVINRVTSLAPAKVFPELADTLGNYAGKLYRGGPLAPSRLLFLVRGLAAATVNGPEIVDKVFLAADPDSLPEILKLSSGPDEFRMFAGHAEWTAGQLESEVKHGAWRVVPASADVVFSDKPTKLWDQLATRADQVTADSHDRPAPPAAQNGRAPGAVSVTPGYQIQPGDVLQISVWREEELEREVLVRPDGGF
jgi:putative transcriptional regulator